MHAVRSRFTQRRRARCLGNRCASGWRGRRGLAENSGAGESSKQGAAVPAAVPGDFTSHAARSVSSASRPAQEARPRARRPEQVLGDVAPAGEAHEEGRSGVVTRVEFAEERADRGAFRRAASSAPDGSCCALRPPHSRAARRDKEVFRSRDPRRRVGARRRPAHTAAVTTRAAGREEPRKRGRHRCSIFFVEGGRGMWPIPVFGMVTVGAGSAVRPGGRSPGSSGSSRPWG